MLQDAKLSDRIQGDGSLGETPIRQDAYSCRYVLRRGGKLCLSLY